MELSHIIYNSAATEPIGVEALVELLEKARRNNGAVGVTGMLLYNEGSFFQVLEGPTEAVQRVAARIAKDPRHERMTVIIEEAIHRRSFGEWTMGFAHLGAGDLGMVQGMNDYFEGQQILSKVDPGRAHKLLSAFGQGRWRVRAVDHRHGISPVVEPNDVALRPPFSIAFQPIIDAAASSVFAYEAQVRGSNGEPGATVLQQVALDEVDSFDTESRQIAISTAGRLGLHSSLYLPFVPRSVGGSRSSLGSTLAAAERSNIDPSRLIFEIKHEVSVIDPQAVSASLKEFRVSGARVSIGDFGSGHAGLSLLELYRPDVVALGPWLVRGIDGHGPRQAIVRGLVQTCSELGIDIIARGVSVPDEYSWLLDEGVRLFQGSLFAPACVDALPTPSVPAAR